VQNAMHEARRLSHVEITERPQRGAKNPPNLVKITSMDHLRSGGRGEPADCLRDRGGCEQVCTAEQNATDAT
jgi:hypothetical protein